MPSVLEEIQEVPIAIGEVYPSKGIEVKDDVFPTEKEPTSTVEPVSLAEPVSTVEEQRSVEESTKESFITSQVLHLGATENPEKFSENGGLQGDVSQVQVPRMMEESMKMEAKVSDGVTIRVATSRNIDLNELPPSDMVLTEVRDETARTISVNSTRVSRPSSISVKKSAASIGWTNQSRKGSTASTASTLGSSKKDSTSSANTTGSGGKLSGISNSDPLSVKVSGVGNFSAPNSGESTTPKIASKGVNPGMSKSTTPQNASAVVSKFTTPQSSSVGVSKSTTPQNANVTKDGGKEQIPTPTNTRSNVKAMHRFFIGTPPTTPPLGKHPPIIEAYDPLYHNALLPRYIPVRQQKLWKIPEPKKKAEPLYNCRAPTQICRPVLRTKKSTTGLPLPHTSPASRPLSARTSANDATTIGEGNEGSTPVMSSSHSVMSTVEEAKTTMVISGNVNSGVFSRLDSDSVVVDSTTNPTNSSTTGFSTTNSTGILSRCSTLTGRSTGNSAGGLSAGGGVMVNNVHFKSPRPSTNTTKLRDSVNIQMTPRDLEALNPNVNFRRRSPHEKPLTFNTNITKVRLLSKENPAYINSTGNLDAEQFLKSRDLFEPTLTHAAKTGGNKIHSKGPGGSNRQKAATATTSPVRIKGPRMLSPQCVPRKTFIQQEAAIRSRSPPPHWVYGTKSKGPPQSLGSSHAARQKTKALIKSVEANQKIEELVETAHRPSSASSNRPASVAAGSVAVSDIGNSNRLSSELQRSMHGNSSMKSSKSKKLNVSGSVKSGTSNMFHTSIRSNGSHRTSGSARTTGRFSVSNFSDSARISGASARLTSHTQTSAKKVNYTARSIAEMRNSYYKESELANQDFHFGNPENLAENLAYSAMETADILGKKNNALSNAEKKEIADLVSSAVGNIAYHEKPPHPPVRGVVPPFTGHQQKLIAQNPSETVLSLTSPRPTDRTSDMNNNRLSNASNCGNRVSTASVQSHGSGYRPSYLAAPVLKSPAGMTSPNKLPIPFHLSPVKMMERLREKKMEMVRKINNSNEAKENQKLAEDWAKEKQIAAEEAKSARDRTGFGHSQRNLNIKPDFDPPARRKSECIEANYSTSAKLSARAKSQCDELQEKSKRKPQVPRFGKRKEEEVKFGKRSPRPDLIVVGSVKTLRVPS